VTGPSPNCASGGTPFAPPPTANSISARLIRLRRTDREIDRLDDDLYGLTEEEIAIVEGTDR